MPKLVLYLSSKLSGEDLRLMVEELKSKLTSRFGAEVDVQISEVSVEPGVLAILEEFDNIHPFLAGFLMADVYTITWRQFCNHLKPGDLKIRMSNVSVAIDY